MKVKYGKIVALLLVVFFITESFSYAQKVDGSKQDVEVSTNKLNSKRFEKNLDKYKTELNLSKRQVKQLSKIDKRYNRLDRKLARKGAARKDKREVAEQKRLEMIEVLDQNQQLQLQALIKKGRFSFENLFGK